MDNGRLTMLEVIWRLIGSREGRLVAVAAVGSVLALASLWGLRAAREVASPAARLAGRATSLMTPQSGELQLRAALEDLDEALRENPRYVPAIRARLDALIQLYEKTYDPRWLTRARAALAGEVAAPLDARQRVLFRARVDLNAGHFADVVRLLENDSALRSSSEDANRLLGRAFSALHRPEPAVGCFRAAIRLNPRSWRAQNDLGYELRTLGRWEEARQAFVRVTELHPDAAVGFTGLGVVLLELGDSAGARQSFQAALERGGSAATYYDLGVTAYYARRNPIAIAFFETALRMNPDSDLFASGLADAFRRLQRREEARDACTRVVDLLARRVQTRPLAVNEQCRRAVCLAKLGRVQAARLALDAIPLGLRNPDVAMARAKLARLEGRSSDSNRYLAEAVRSGYPAALLAMDPDFASTP